MKQEWRRRLTYGTNAVFVTGLVVGVLVVLYLLADAYRVRWDFSAEAGNTLQADTVKKLALLDADGETVTITAFSNQRGKDDSYVKDRAIEDLLTELDLESRVLDWRIVDFDRERLTAESMGVTEYGHVVVQRGSDRIDIRDRDLFRRKGRGADRQLEFIGETALSRALSQLLSPSRRVVYFTRGHGEPNPSERGPGGLSELVSALDVERFDAEPLDLLRAEEGAAPVVPEDAALVVLSGMRGPLSAQEEDVLLEYVGRGKPLLVAVDAGAPVPAFLARMGVRVPDGLAMDPTLVFPYRDRPVPVYKSHPVTDGLRESGLVTVLAAPAPLSLAEPSPDGVRASPVLVSSRDGWIERGGELEGGTPIYQPEIDGEGPVVMAAALQLLPGEGIVRSSKPLARVLVVGDSELMTNALIGDGPGNRDFMINAVHWLAGEDNRTGVVTARSASSRRLALSQDQTRRIQLVSLTVLPSLIALLGLFTWYSRRGR